MPKVNVAMSFGDQRPAMVSATVLDLTRLRSFVEAARLGSFAAAANLEGYTAPAVSQHVAALERYLGCELLIRGPRGVTTTEAGDVLRTRAEQLLNEANLAEIAVREASGQIKSLRVGAFPSGAQHLLPSALSAVRAQVPDAELALLHFEPPDGLQRLLTGDVDAVLTHRYPGVAETRLPGVQLHAVLDDPIMVVVWNKHPLASRPHIEAHELADATFISGEVRDANRIALETICARAGFKPRVAFETVDYAVTQTLVASQLGIAFMPQLAGTPNRQTRHIELRLDGDTTSRQISLACRHGERSPLVLALLRTLAQSA